MTHAQTQNVEWELAATNGVAVAQGDGMFCFRFVILAPSACTGTADVHRISIA